MNEEDGMECVMHYRDSCSTYSTLKSLSQNQYDRLLKAKSARSDCDIAIMHEEQCSSIPHNGFDKITMAFIYNHVIRSFLPYCVPHNREDERGTTLIRCYRFISQALFQL